MWTPTASASAGVRPVDFVVPSLVVVESARERRSPFGRPTKNRGPHQGAILEGRPDSKPRQNDVDDNEDECFWSNVATKAFETASGLDDKDVARPNHSVAAAPSSGLRYRNSFLPPGGRGRGIARSAMFRRVGGRDPVGSAGRARNFAPSGAKGFLDYAG